MPTAIDHLNPPTGQMADNVVGFARALRAAGLPVGPGSVIDAMNALQVIDIGKRADVFTTLEAIFVKRHEHALIFAQAFDLFFRAAEEWKHILDSIPLPDHAKKKPPPASRRVQEAMSQPAMREEMPQAQEQELRLWELTVFKFAGEYLNRVVGVLKAGRAVEQPILARLVKGLNRIFVGMLVSNDRELFLATSFSYSYARVSRLLVESVSARPRKGERIEIVWRDDKPVLKVILDDEVSVPLELNLIRFEFLSRVAEGALPNSFSKECHEDILAYKSLLLSGLAKREQRYGGTAQPETLVFRLLDLDDGGNPIEEVIELTHAG